MAGNLIGFPPPSRQQARRKSVEPLTPAEQNAALAKASRWIRCWRTVGGGFSISAAGTDIAVSLVRAPMADEKLEAATAKAADRLRDQLLRDPDLQITVSSLARDSYLGTLVPPEDQAEPTIN